jgi:hypothetical protein
MGPAWNEVFLVEDLSSEWSRPERSRASAAVRRGAWDSGIMDLTL